MLGGGEMTTRQHANVEASGAQPCACRHDLFWLVGILLAADKTEADRSAQRVIQPGEVPAPGMGFVFGDESRGSGEERGPIVACDRIIEIIEFRIRYPICRSKHSRAAPETPEERQVTL